MSSDPTSIPEDGKPPCNPSMTFDDGDVILCSCDGVEFHLHQWPLSRASTVFRDMFKLSANQEASEPIVMAEDAYTLDVLLHWVYPTAQKPELTSIEKTAELLEIAETKLLFECAVQPLKTIISSLIDSLEHPLRAWALAVRYNLPDARKKAFKRCLVANDQVMNMDDAISELEAIPAARLWDLLRTRRRAIGRARNRIETYFTDTPRIKSIYFTKAADINPLSELATSEVFMETVYLSGNGFAENRSSRSDLRSGIQYIVNNANEPMW